METNKSKRISLPDILLSICTLAFLAGMLFLFGPCGPAEDGHWMTCHWAGQAVIGVAVVLVALALGGMAARQPAVKLGLAAAMIPAAGLAAALPGGLIDLCMMDQMRCRAVMRPAVLVFAAVIIVLAVIDVILQRRKSA